MNLFQHPKANIVAIAALLGLGGATSSAASLTGSGTIDLNWDSTVPGNQVSAGARFAWSGSSLFIGQASAGQQVYGGLSIFRQGPFNSDSIAIMGEAAPISAAIGIGSEANEGSTALGTAAIASGFGSISISSVWDSSGAVADDWFSVAIGYGARSYGVNSVALGALSTAIGSDSLALGSNSTASGNYSIALVAASALGTDSIAIGKGANANAVGSVALGRYNVGNLRRDGTSVTSTADPGDPLFTLGNGTATNQRANAFTVYRDGTAQVGGAGTITGSTTTGLTLQAGGTNKDIVLDASGTGKIVLNDNVGIGTANPDYQLTVNGTIHAKEVLVDNAILPDYVFADDYRNAPLSEVEAHIKEHRHLPGVPSAREIAERGMNVTQMQNALLAKVEELTLHLIAQEKRLSEQDRRLQQLEDENRALRGHDIRPEL